MKGSPHVAPCSPLLHQVSGWLAALKVLIHAPLCPHPLLPRISRGNCEVSWMRCRHGSGAGHQSIYYLWMLLLQRCDAHFSAFHRLSTQSRIIFYPSFMVRDFSGWWWSCFLATIFEIPDSLSLIVRKRTNCEQITPLWDDNLSLSRFGLKLPDMNPDYLLPTWTCHFVYFSAVDMR